MQIIDLINKGSEYLLNSNLKSYQFDSEILLSNVLKKKRENLIVDYSKEVSQESIKNFRELIMRRSNNEPVAYILKTKE